MDNLWYTYLSMGLGDVGWLPVNPGLVAPRAQWLRGSLGACWATTVRTMEKKTSQTFPPPQNSRWGRSFPHSLWSCSYLGNWCWKRICGECTDPPSRWVTGLAREKHWDQIRSRIQPVSQLVPRQQADLQNQRIQTENVQDQLASQDLHRSNFISFPIYGIHMYIISVCLAYMHMYFLIHSHRPRLKQFPGLQGQGHDCIVVNKWLSHLCDEIDRENLEPRQYIYN